MTTVKTIKMDHSTTSTPPPSYEASVGNQYVGSSIHPGTKFCGQCGTACACADFRFCTSCGSSLTGSTLPTVSVTSAPPPIQIIDRLPTAPPIQRQGLGSSNRMEPDMGDMYVCIENRLIYDFEKLPCLCEPSGLHQEVKYNIPFQLCEKGITAEQWLEWMTELDEIQKLPPSICCCLTMFCFPGCLIQSILCALICPMSANHCLSWLPCYYGNWYEALRNWMQKVNDTLTNYGMYAKLLTYKPFNHAPKSKRYHERITGKDHNYEMSFLAIAVTSDESRKLRAESWDHGVNDGCTSGIGRCL